MEEQVISNGKITFFYNHSFNFLSPLGVGKSKTIEAMAKWAENILLKEDHESLKPRVLITAFTGKAASLIGM